MNINALTHHHVYDCTDIGDGGFVSSWGGQGGGRGSANVRLFGNSNVGSLELTNLQIAGQLGGDTTFITQRWYARHNFAESPLEIRDRIRAWANSVVATFVMGNKPQWQRSLYELFERRPRTTDDDVVARVPSDPFPVVLPPRQSFMVNVDQFGWNIDELTPMLTAGRSGAYRPRVWIHLEGVICHEGAATIDKVVQALLAEAKQRATVEEQVTAWLSGQIEQVPQEYQGQLHAVRDGILEGRHRS